MELGRKEAVGLGLAGVGLGLGYAGYRVYGAHMNRLSVMVHDRQCELDAEMEEGGIMLKKHHNPALWSDILSWDYPTLRGHLMRDDVRPVDVLCAYLSAALKAHEETNCLVGILPSIEKQAMALELKYKGNAEKPALYGLPVSIKENVAISGQATTCGYAQFLGQEWHRNSPIVDSLNALGAIPFVRTNVPQSVMSFLACNPIYGLTTNPADKTRSCGGSSGGEGALIGAGGSMLGIGGDIAGSIRLPAHWNGIAGLKPTMGRWASLGRGVSPGTVLVSSTQGPMAPDTGAIVAFCRALYSEDSPMIREAGIPPLLFRDDVYGSSEKLRIGYYEDDGWFPATPACRRAVREAAEKLKSLGHEVVKWQPPNPEEIWRLIWPLCLPDGGDYVSDCLSLGLEEPLLAPLSSLIGTPRWLRPLRAKILSAGGDGRKAAQLRALPDSSGELRFFFCANIEAYASVLAYRSVFTDAWSKAGLSALLSPPCACPALPHDVVMRALGVFNYTALYNVLDWPAGVAPWTKVTSEDEAAMSDYPESDLQERLVKQACSSGTQGLPVGVQVAAKPFDEETVLRVMNLLETK